MVTIFDFKKKMRSIAIMKTVLIVVDVVTTLYSNMLMCSKNRYIIYIY